MSLKPFAVKSDLYCTFRHATKHSGTGRIPRLFVRRRELFFLHREREAESKFIRSVGAAVKSWSERGLMLVAKGLVAVHFPISSSSSLPHGVFE